MNNLLTQALNENNIQLTPDQQAQILLYLKLIQKWNKVFNLTAITDFKSMIYLHIIDSLLVAPFLKGKNILDVGSGAGLPGIPLAILNPDQSFTLLDKNNKKTRFLTQAVAELKLKNVAILHGRAEDIQSDIHFDSILSRAFGTIQTFVESSAHLLSEDGIFIAMKGKNPQNELQVLPSRFELVDKVTALAMKGMKLERHLACLKLK